MHRDSALRKNKRMTQKQALALLFIYFAIFCQVLLGFASSVNNYEGLAKITPKYIHTYRACTGFLAGKLPYIRSYTECFGRGFTIQIAIYGVYVCSSSQLQTSGHKFVYVLVTLQHKQGATEQRLLAGMQLGQTWLILFISCSGLARTIYLYIYIRCMRNSLAQKSPNIRSCMVCIYGSSQPYLINLVKLVL